jgi:hypothetical protein
MTDYRHHVATRREIIFVPIPVAGTVRETHRAKPGKYPHERREAWRPATRPPNKAERIVRWLDQCRRQEEAIREMLRPDARLLEAWLGGVAV